MNSLISKLLSPALLATFLCTASADWHQWRGPSLNGSAAASAKPPLSWSAIENVRWKLAIPGAGSGTPVITGNNLFVVTAINTGKTPRSKDQQPGPRSEQAPDTLHQFKLLCVNRSTGKIRWDQTLAELVPHSGHHKDHFYASASPITDGKLVWAHFGSRGTFCLTIDGKPVWSRADLGLMQTRGGFGDGSSPALHGDTLVIPWDQETGSYIVALDKNTGKTLWKQSREEEPTSWATPLIIEHEGKGLVIQSGHKFLRAYDLKSGKVIWKASGQTTRPIPTPVIHKGNVIVASGHRGAFMGAYQLAGAKGDITGSDHELWTLRRNTPDVPSLLISNNRLYFTSRRDGIISCANPQSGELHYGRQRIPGLREVYASPVAANGHVFITDRQGVTVVIKDADNFEVVATNELGEPMDASPVIIGDQLYLRAAKHLYCLGE